MSNQLLNLPINIPWKQIAVSPDMMDEKFCNKLFPFAWRSSMAISVYEPKPEELPEELCGDQITYIKVTTSITGYQPNQKEISQIDEFMGNKSIVFSDLSSEDFEEAFKRMTSHYFACYGVMLNVAVFPYPGTKKELIERNRIHFSKIHEPGAPNNSPFLEPGANLDNPYTHPTGVEFDSGQDQNSLVDLIQIGSGSDAELNLQKKMIINLPATTGLAAVEAKIVYQNAAGIKMEAYSADVLTGTAESVSEPNQVNTLLIKGENITKIIITSTDNESSLLEFAYFTSKEVTLELSDYPHIIDFEPKRRDLYQAASVSGEVLSGSNSGIATNKSLTHTESTESSLKATAGYSAGPVGIDASIEGKITNKVVDQDERSVQTDSSREKRETQGTTTQLSQMYNLLTGYHAGTNRAAFLSLARPHVLQPTDHRTFVQGLRIIEGMQEYFLIVSRPKDIEGLCIEANLETGNYPENANIPESEEEPEDPFEDFAVSETADGGKAPGINPFGGSSAECKNIVKSFSIPDGFIVDQSPERMRVGDQPIESGWDPGHPGVAYLEQNEVQTISNLEYDIIDGKLIVTGTVCGTNSAGTTLGFGGVDGISVTFNGHFRVFLKPEQAGTNYTITDEDIGQLLITSRGLCTCFKSGECIEIIPPPKSKDPINVDCIVDEPKIRINKAIMTKSASRQDRMPIAKEFLSKVQASLTQGHSSTSRRAFDDTVGFLESDYFKEQIKSLLPEDHLKKTLRQVKGLPDKVVKALGADLTTGQALSMDLARFARRTGLSIKEASKARLLLLGLTDVSNDKTSDDSKQEYDG